MNEVQINAALEKFKTLLIEQEARNQKIKSTKEFKDFKSLPKIVIGVSNGMAAMTPYLIVLILVGVIAYRIAVRNEVLKVAVDTQKLKIPIVGTMLEKIELSKFCRNLSAMQKSGITLVSSLGIVVSAIKNRKIAKEIEKAEKNVNSIKGKLTNEKFVSRAPEAVVAAERERLAKAESLLAQLKDSEARLKK